MVLLKVCETKIIYYVEYKELYAIVYIAYIKKTSHEGRQ